MLAILSDTHGNLPALQAVLGDLAHYPVSGYILAGDYTGCPQANETLQTLRYLPAPTWTIIGNSDINVLKLADGNAPPGWYTSKQFGLLRWVYRNLSPENLVYLRNLPEQCVVEIPAWPNIRVVHGSLCSPYEQVFPEGDPTRFAQLLNLLVEPVMICGHTHLPWQVSLNGRLAINPGAVCGSLNGDPRAHYALLLWENNTWQVIQRRVEYDLARLRDSFFECGLLAEGGALARAFLLSNLTGTNTSEEFLAFASHLMKAAGYIDLSVIPDEIWDQAEMQFDWARYMEA